MLHLQTLDAGTQSLLQRLMKDPNLQQMRLVGGTALALQIGHRKSIDLDLFGRLPIDQRELSLIMSAFGNVTPIQNSEHIHVYLIDGVKVDIVNYSYPWLQPFINEDDWRLANLQDIAAMKLSAITGRGSKKDFIDIYFLLQHFRLQDMLDFYQQKYRDGATFLVLKSLGYFEDAEKDAMPDMIMEADWTAVKSAIRLAIKEYVQISGADSSS